MKIQDADKIILVISGGAGKNIMATAVVAAIKNNFPNKEIVVATPWVEAWTNNPNVSHVVNFIKETHLYLEHINKSNSFVMLNDPYFAEDYIYKRKNLIEVWCDMFSVKFNGETPKLYFTEEEKKSTHAKLPEGKPLFFIQTSGGAQNQEYPISWMRDMPLSLGQSVVNEMTKRGFYCIHLRRPDQYALENTYTPTFTTREMLCSIEFSDRRLFIDSVAQHAAAALDKPSVVTWIGNDPLVFGEKIHTNIVTRVEPKFRHMIDSYLEAYNITGVIHECPYDTDKLFDLDEVMREILK